VEWFEATNLEYVASYTAHIHNHHDEKLHQPNYITQYGGTVPKDSSSIMDHTGGLSRQDISLWMIFMLGTWWPSNIPSKRFLKSYQQKRPNPFLSQSHNSQVFFNSSHSLKILPMPMPWDAHLNNVKQNPPKGRPRLVLPL